MAITNDLSIQSLSLDLNNFRTVSQVDELEATRALIAISPEWFWALMESLIADGYLPIENIIAIKNEPGTSIVVKEGNRRIASLKLVHKLIDGSQLGLPNDILAKIDAISIEWLNANTTVPCTVYEHTDIDLVNKIINRTHGKNERAGRFPWPSVAKARYNRDVSGASENGLTLLEKYLAVGRNLTANQRERWSGDFQISVLDEAIGRIATRLGASNSADLTNRYPNLQLRDSLESLILDIGLKLVRFEDIRSTELDFATTYGIPPLTNTTSTGSTQGQNTSTSSGSTVAASSAGSSVANINSGSTNNSTPRGRAAAATNTPRSVKSKMRSFIPVGNNREKVVDLKNEILHLTIEKTPIAFCFLLRSLFEISAKVYCSQNGIATTTPSGRIISDRKLIDLLKDATNQLTSNNNNQQMIRQLHGALTQLNTSNSILSVTSMNQLVHNPNFSVIVGDVCTLFHNIYPLLAAMN